MSISPNDHTVYFLRDTAGTLLYVGVTRRSSTRLHEHSKSQSWWRETAQVELEHFATESEAVCREQAAIHSLHPRYNKTGMRRRLTPRPEPNPTIAVPTWLYTTSWPQRITDVCSVLFGTSMTLNIQHSRRGAVATASEKDNKILVIGAGKDEARAWRALMLACLRDDHRPTTQEVAVILGVSSSRVRQLVMDGKLTPLVEGDTRHPALFEPGDVYRLAAAKD